MNKIKLLVVLSMFGGVSCRTPKQIYKTSERFNENIYTQETDTMTEEYDEMITHFRDAEGNPVEHKKGTKKTINRKNKAQVIKNTGEKNSYNQDNLTPTLLNIERKAKKDSLKNNIKAVKEETKQVKAKYSWVEALKLAVVIFALLLVGKLIKKD